MCLATRPLSVRLCLALALILAAALPAAAQDAHHDTNQYGSTNALKAGAGTGGTRDSSATWYNPGALGFIDNPSIAVSANAYRLGVINLGDFAGIGKDVTSTPITTVPLIASGLMMDDNALPGHRFGFCLINKTVFTVSASERVRADKDVLDHANPDTAGNEDYVGSVGINEGITEVWLGGSWSYKPAEVFSFGVTLFAAMRQQSTSFSAYARAVNPSATGELATSDLVEEFDYLNVRLLARIGFALDFGDLKLGFAWTTPSVSAFGTGSVLFQFTFVNVDLDSDNTGDSAVLEDRQTDLSAKFQSNMVFAFGLQYTLDDVTFALDVKWYAAAGRFNIMEPDANNLELGAGGGPATLTTADFTPTYKYSSVANISFAALFQFDRSVAMILGFNTDLSYAADDGGGSGEDLYFTYYDLFHFTGGLVIAEYGKEAHNLDKLIRQVSIGVIVSHGSGTTGQDLDFANADESNFLLGLDTDKNVDVGYFSFTVILGYTQHF